MKKGNIIRKDNDILLAEEHSTIYDSRYSDELISIKKAENSFILGSKAIKSRTKFLEDSSQSLNNLAFGDIKSSESIPWIVLRHSNENNGRKLTEGDILKFGRVKLRVKEIRNFLGNNHVQNNDKIIPAFEKNIINKKDFEKISNSSVSRTSIIECCRFCLSDENCEDNPLVSPCNCMGSMKNVHLLCMQEWLRSKMQIKQNKVCTTFLWKKFECELCKTPFSCFIIFFFNFFFFPLFFFIFFLFFQ